MKVLILRFSAIGDIVLTSPVIDAIKTYDATIEIHAATGDSFRSLYENNPAIAKTFSFDKRTADSLKQMIEQLKAERYDHIIDLHHNLRSRKVKRALGIKSSSFNKLNIEKWVYVNLKINRLPAVHIVARYLETLLPLGIKPVDNGLSYYFKDGSEPALKLPQGVNKESGYQVVVLGATHFTKQLPIERTAELVVGAYNHVNLPVIILGGPSDVERSLIVSQMVAEQSPETVLVNMTGQTSLDESAVVVKYATVVYSNDTGLMHIAAAFNRPIVSLWGNTTPALGMYPYKTPHLVWEVNDLKCRPCSKIGYAKCPKGHFKCMQEISFDFEAVKRLISSAY